MPFHNKLARLGKQVGRVVTSRPVQEARRLLVFDERPVLRLVRGDIKALPWAALEVGTVLPIAKIAKLPKAAKMWAALARLEEGEVGRIGLKGITLAEETAARDFISRSSPLFRTMFRQERELIKRERQEFLSALPRGRTRRSHIAFLSRPLKTGGIQYHLRAGRGTAYIPPLWATAMTELTEKEMKRLRKSSGKLVEREAGEVIERLLEQSAREQASELSSIIPRSHIDILEEYRQLSMRHLGREIKEPSRLPLGIQYVPIGGGVPFTVAGRRTGVEGLSRRKSPRSLLMIKESVSQESFGKAFPLRPALYEQDVFLHELAHAVEQTRRPAERLKRSGLVSRQAREELVRLLESDDPRTRRMAAKIAKSIVGLSVDIAGHKIDMPSRGVITRALEVQSEQGKRSNVLRFVDEALRSVMSKEMEKAIYEINPHHATSFSRTAFRLYEKFDLPRYFLAQEYYKAFANQAGASVPYGLVPKRTFIMETLSKLRHYKKRRPRLP